MKKTAAILAFLTLAAGAAYATGDASRFIVRVEKIELQSASGAWVTLAEPKADVEITTEGAALLETKNAGLVPPGEYQNVRITLSETVRFAGRDEKYFTKEGGEITIGGTSSKAADLGTLEIKTFKTAKPTLTETEAEHGLVTQHLNLDFEDRDDVSTIATTRPFKKKLAVKEGSSLRVSLGLDVRGTVRYAWKDFFSGFASEPAVYYLPNPGVSEVIVKCDTQTLLITSEALAWEF